MNIITRLRLWLQRFKTMGGGFLCDNCAYDYDGACHRPERPNAKVCPDYRKSGSAS